MVEVDECREEGRRTVVPNDRGGRKTVEQYNWQTERRRRCVGEEAADTGCAKNLQVQDFQVSKA